METLNKFITELLCKHNYTICDIYNTIVKNENILTITRKCTKCGKIIEDSVLED